MLTQLSFDDLIASPLIAASQANSMMAREQVKFIMDFCFEKVGDNYEPINIQMSISRKGLRRDEKDEPIFKETTAQFQLPMITLVPLNSLSVQEINIDFSMEVTSHVEKKEVNNLVSSTDKEKKVMLCGNVSRFNNKVSKQSSNSSNNSISSNIDISIKAGSLPLPTGLTTILEAYTKNILTSNGETKQI